MGGRGGKGTARGTDQGGPFGHSEGALRATCYPPGKDTNRRITNQDPHHHAQYAAWAPPRSDKKKWRTGITPFKREPPEENVQREPPKGKNVKQKGKLPCSKIIPDYFASKVVFHKIGDNRGSGDSDDKGYTVYDVFCDTVRHGVVLIRGL